MRLSMLTLLRRDVGERLRRAAIRGGWHLIGIALAVGAGLIALLVLAAAAYLLLATTVEPWQAAAITGAALALVAFVGIWTCRPQAAERESPPSRPHPEEEEDPLTQLTSRTVSDALRGSNVDTVDLMLAGLAAGVVLGWRSRRRTPRRRSDD